MPSYVGMKKCVKVCLYKSLKKYI